MLAVAGAISNEKEQLDSADVPASWWTGVRGREFMVANCDFAMSEF